ncbi:SAM-dependent methyltransferase [Thermosulfurimonas dismutans]|uniref:Ribosomal RNA large subunit methyltransferase E n=1 Tax=Thermosulfurimonas dismutans TaxID=999894 RepID=A0A179D7A4_9BACT|nr:RlmE family RNA methyltransferase [Thermosulfurimonas dismutans]OAQ21619.1 Ribosomal RNA large subunit methyltransferase [Thermosulfurimonas dismutans]
MARKKKNPWADHYTRKAKQEGFPARSVYKLKEAQSKYRLLKPGDVVLDLGCAPGAWSKYALKIVGPKGLVVGLDLGQVSLKTAHFVFLQKDVFEISSEELRALSPKDFYDAVLSDLAPKTTGDRSGDHFRSLHLARRALELACELLSPQGVFMVKVFEGERFPVFREEVARHFKRIKLFRPKSTRSSSREIFVLAFERKLS